MMDVCNNHLAGLWTGATRTYPAQALVLLFWIRPIDKPEQETAGQLAFPKVLLGAKKVTYLR